MKRMISTFVAALMLLSLLSTCGTAFAEDDTVHALLSDWADYLNRTEQNYAAMLWTLAYVEKALNSNDWNDFLKARLAVSTANMYVEQTELEDEEMSSKGYADFNAAKQDVGLVRASREGYAMDKDTLLGEFEYLQMELDTGIFSKRNMENLKDYVHLKQGYYEMELEYAAAQTDYLLAVLAKSEISEKFQNAVQENCPVISGYQSKTEMTADESEARGIKLFHAMEELVKSMRKLNGRMESDVDTQQHWAESGNTTAWEENLNMPAKLPDSLPYPIWEEELFASVYFQRDENGRMLIPKPGDAITEAPAGCILTYTGVEEDSVYAYMLLLMENGVEVKKDKVEDNSFEADCLYKGISFTVSWEDNTATITMPNGIVCLWLS